MLNFDLLHLPARPITTPLSVPEFVRNAGLVGITAGEKNCFATPTRRQLYYFPPPSVVWIAYAQLSLVTLCGDFSSLGTPDIQPSQQGSVRGNIRGT